MRWRQFPMIAALVLVCGCEGSGGKVPVHPVSGQVIYDGKPAAGVQVYFVPTTAPMVPKIPNNPHGVTGSDGRFQLTTYEDNDGAAEGAYQVLLLWPESVSDTEESTKDKLFGWFDGAHTKLKADVKPGTNAIPAFTIKAITGPPEVLKGIPGKN